MKQTFVSKILNIGLSLLGVAMMLNVVDAFVDEPDKIPEIGEVRWSSDLEAAKQKSEKTGRPVFLLFQEIPG